MALRTWLLLVLFVGVGAGLVALLLPEDAPSLRFAVEGGGEVDATREGAVLAGRGVPLTRAPLATLLEALLDENGEVVPEAAAALRERARREPDVAATLVARIRALLEEGSWRSWSELRRLTSALAALGEEGARALLPLLEDPSGPAWNALVYHVVWFGADAGPLLPTLLAQAETMRRDDPVRLSAILNVLRGLGPVAEPAVGLLTSLLEPPLQDAHVHLAASALLAITGPTEATFALLRAVLEDPETEVRSQVIWVLGQQGPAAAPFVPEMILLLRDPEPATRSAAALALGRIGVATPEVLRELAFLLVDDHQKFAAGEALAQLGADGAKVLLDTARSAESIDTRVYGLQAYLAVSGDPAPAMPILLGILREDVERGWKQQVLGMLRWVQPLPEDPALLEALTIAAEDPVLGASAYPLLLRLPGEQGRRLVVGYALTAALPEDRLFATKALLQTRQEIPEVGQALLGLVSADLSRQAKQEALDAFASAKPPVPVTDGMAALETLLRDEDRFLRYAALRATLALAGDRTPLVDVYAEALDDLDVRRVAAAGLAMDTAQAGRALPGLIARARMDAREFGYVGGDVATAIVTLAPHAKGTEAALRAAAATLSGDARAKLEELAAKL